MNPDLTFSHSFGSEGSDDEQLECPQDVAISNRGRIFVTEVDSSYIKVFSPYGHLLWMDDIKVYPVGVAVSSCDVLYKTSTFEGTLHDVLFVTESDGDIGKKCIEYSTMEILEDNNLTLLQLLSKKYNNNALFEPFDEVVLYPIELPVAPSEREPSEQESSEPESPHELSTPESTTDNSADDIHQGRGIAVDNKGYLYVCGINFVSIYKL